MDSEKKGQLFDAVVMSVRCGSNSAARNAFEASLKLAVNEKLDRIIRIARKNGAFSLIEEIQNMMET